MNDGNDEIVSVEFGGTKEQVLASSIARSGVKGFGAKPRFIPKGEVFWIDFQVRAIVDGEILNFPCQFSIKQGGNGDIKIQDDDKAHLGEKFGALLEREIETVNQAIAKFLAT